jgi:hypothetical protein
VFYYVLLDLRHERISLSIIASQLHLSYFLFCMRDVIYARQGVGSCELVSPRYPRESNI